MLYEYSSMLLMNVVKRRPFDFVKYFQRSVSASRAARGSLSICFSCRHYPILVLETALEVRVEDENHYDIETYTQDELRVAIRDEIKISILTKQIVDRASGSFQWVILVVSRACELHRKGKSIKFIETQIQKTPPELDSLYRELLQGIGEEDVPQSLQLMQWILFAVRPLTVDELQHAVIVDADTSCKSISELQNLSEYAANAEEMERRLKDLCRGLAETKQHKQSRVVQFIHHSVNDFLIQRGLGMLDGSFKSIDQAIGHAHRRLSIACIEHIAMEEVGNKLGQLKVPILRRERRPTFLEYAVIYWAPHAKIVEAKGISQGYLLEFFQWPSNQILQRWALINIRYDPSCGPRPGGALDLLHVASAYGLLSVLKAILETGIDPDFRGVDGQTPLYYAALEDNGPVVKLLLENGASVKSRDDLYQTPLFWAAYEGNEATAKMLLDNKANIDPKDFKGRTPLSWAAYSRKEPIVKLLLKNGADKDNRDNIGRTPLSWAAEGGKERVVKLPLENGADANSRDDKGRTPLSWAMQYRPRFVHEEHRESALQSWDVKDDANNVKQLLENEAEVQSRDNKGRTPLSWAVIKGNEAAIKLLLKRKADTPLSRALSSGQKAIVELLRKGINTESRDNDG